jgi:hypothetical protein
MTHTAAAAAVIFGIISSCYSPPVFCSGYGWGVIASMALDYQVV